MGRSRKKQTGKAAYDRGWQKAKRGTVFKITELPTDALLEELARRGGHPGVMAEAALLAGRKAQDYHSDKRSLPLESIVRDNYFPFGLKSHVQMLHTKVARLVSLAEAPTVNFESSRDTCLDLVNYAGFAAEWLTRMNGGQT